MTLILSLLLAAAAIAAAAFFAMWRAELADASRHRSLFSAAQYQLGKVHDALDDIPKDATTPLGEIVFRIKSDRLRYQNQARELENLLNVPALDSKKTSVEKVAFLLQCVKSAAEGKKISNRDEDY